ncbi:MFS transporter [Mycetocola manganoxydans]|uniref:MFS transporter n=1 Tax=Mycetocola manganoxydans TaxID=699879 RepID=A0A3L6ZS60_9MICO|nr:MFS transporter [Mycetocola manganoxydans]RLP70717.1 MFS transporter [Mycetocola manganoxydans]GHD48717.1 MFS transporter [Mycetocola manganoxydans]
MSNTATGDARIAALQRRSVWFLSAGQVLGGFAIGATLSLGALLAADVSGSDAWSGMAATMSTLGAAITAIPLARVAVRHGRRVALSVGALVSASGAMLTVVAASVRSFPLLLVALALIGTGSAVGLQARFAATDLATDRTRGRDLSIVVWATTLGAVAGPNLLEPGDAVGRIFGLVPLTGPFLFGITAQVLAATVYLVALRPDPLLTARALGAETDTMSRPAPTASESRSRERFAILTVALSHATMVSVMSMTPVHLQHHGASLTIIGLTISLHVAGMFALSPVFGMLADRLGRMPVILLGQGLFLASLATLAIGAETSSAVTAGLVLLGLGWSASTVAGSALVTESTAALRRPRVQGITDTLMNLSGAAGGALAGPTLALLGFDGLSLVASALVAAVLVAAILVARRPAPAFRLSD